MSRKQLAIIILVFLAAFILRLYFVPNPGYERDIQLFKIWSQTAVVNGVVNVYDKTWCDYTPSYLYVLKAIGSFYKIFYPDFREHTYLFDLLIKFPAILADFIIGALVLLFLRKKFSFKVSMLASCTYLFNPVIFFNSALWGQVDSVVALVALSSILALVIGEYYWSWGLIVVAILLKTQMAVLLPIIVLVTWQKKGLKFVLGGVMASFLSSVFILLPFIYFHKIDQVIDKILNAVGEYPFLSMNAFNVWWILGGTKNRLVLDTNLFLNLFTYRTLGMILFLLFIALVLRYLYQKKNDGQAVFLASALSIFAFFMLPTEMHERYIVPVFVFLILAVIKDKNLRIIYGILSLTAFLNLFIVLGWAYPGSAPNLNEILKFIPLDIFIAILNFGAMIYFLKFLLNNTKIKNREYYILILLLLFLFSFNYFKQKQPVYLSDLSPKETYQQWGRLMKDRSIDNHQLTVNGYIFPKGLGTHANSSIVYSLAGRYKFLEGYVGMDDEQNKQNKIEFQVYVDRNLVYKSGVFSGFWDPCYFIIPIKGAKEINLVVSDGGDGINCDHADWLNVKVLP